MESRLLERDAKLLEKFRAAQEQMLRASGLDKLKSPLILYSGV